MIMVRQAFLAALASLMVTAFGSARGFAQDSDDYSFDCVGVVRATGLAKLSAPEAGVSLDLVLKAEDWSPPSGATDLISLDENVVKDLKRPFLIGPFDLTKLTDAMASSYACALMLVRFHATADPNVLFDLVSQSEPIDASKRGGSLVLILASAGDLKQMSDRLLNWEYKDWNIPVLASGSDVEQSQSVFSIPFSAGLFEPFDLSAQTNLGDAQVAVVDLTEQRISEAFLPTLPPRLGTLYDYNSRLIVLCYFRNCVGAARDITGDRPPPSQGTLTQGDRPADVAILTTQIDRTEVSGLTNNPETGETDLDATDIEATSLVSPVGETPEQSTASEARTQILGEGQEIVTVRLRRQDGAVTDFPLDSIGGFTCLIFALSPETFLTPPRCQGRQFDSLKTNGGVLSQLSDGGLEFTVPQAGNLRRLRVLWPESSNGFQCQMTAVYEDATGRRTELTLNPERQSDGRNVFVGTFAGTPSATGGYVPIEIKSLSPADCGFVSKQLRVAISGDTGTVDLSDTLAPRRTIHYFPLANAGGTSHRLQDQADRADLAQSILAAVQSSHEQIAQRYRTRDMAWGISRAHVSVLRQDNSRQALVELSDIDLRNDPSRQFVRAFWSIGQSALDTVIRPLEVLERAASELARQGGDGQHDWVIMGQVRPQVLDDLDSICDPGPYERILQANPQIHIYAFPVVDLKQDTDLSLDPELFAVLDLNPGLQSFPGSMLRCQNLPQRLTIAPYMAEAWRRPDDIIQRYGVNLSDQLALLLDGLVLTENR